MARRPRFRDLANAVVGNDRNAIRLYLEAGGDACRCDDDGETLLHYAARHGRFEVARLLVDAGASPTATNRYGETPADAAEAALAEPASERTEHWRAARRRLVAMLRGAADERLSAQDAVAGAPASGAVPSPAPSPAFGPPEPHPSGQIPAPGDLPELAGEELRFTWDEDGGGMTVIRYGEQVLWRQRTDLEDPTPFEDAARALRARYGDRVRDLEPTPLSTRRLFFDSFGAAAAVAAVRAALASATPIPSTRPRSVTPYVPPGDLGMHPEPVGAVDGDVWQLAVSPDGTLAAAAHTGGVSVWSLASGGLEAAWPGPWPTTSAVFGFVEEGRGLAFQDGRDIVVLDWRSGSVRRRIDIGAWRQLFGGAVSLDGTRIAVLSDNLIEYESLELLNLHCVDASDGGVLWRQSGNNVRAHDGSHWFRSPIPGRYSLAFSPDLSELYEVAVYESRRGASWSVHVYDGEDGSLLHRHWAAEDGDRALVHPVVSPAMPAIVDATADRRGVAALDVRTLEPVAAVASLATDVRPAAASPDGALLASFLSPMVARVDVCDVRRGARYGTVVLPRDGGAPSACMFTPDSASLVIGTRGGRVLRAEVAKRVRGRERP